jgi:uncharacterized OB-fold protein
MPVPTPTTQPFWDALKEHKVRIQRCNNCSHWVFYPRANCSQCLSPDLEWREVSGRGKLYTFTIARRPTAPQFQDEVPQMLAVVELDEGVRITSTLVDVDETAIKVGMALKPSFDERDGVTLLRFQPA